MTANGDEAIQAAEKRAESTRERNLPPYGTLPDMPVPGDTANLREGPNLNDACLALLPLVGVWRGEGEVDYPTIDGPYRFGMQLTIAHDGRPFLTHESRAWELGTDAVVRSSTAKDVTASQRLYGIVNGELGYVEERAMMGQELQPHTSALLRRVVG